MQNVLIGIDAHAKLPFRARWIAQATAAPDGATKRVMRRPSLNGGLLFPDSTIDLGMIQACMETEYRVQGDPSATLRVGVVCPALAALHRVHRADCSAFITACNPFSQAFDEAANAERQATLRRELKQ